MKKIYQTPEVLVLSCAAEQALLQTSNMETNTEVEISGQIDDRLVKKNSGGAWDDYDTDW